MSTFWNMYQAERKKNVGALLFSFEKKNKLRNLKHVLEIEKTIMQNDLDFGKWFKF